MNKNKIIEFKIRATEIRYQSNTSKCACVERSDILVSFCMDNVAG